jgi:hypothetical protein
VPPVEHLKVFGVAFSFGWQHFYELELLPDLSLALKPTVFLRKLHYLNEAL